MTKRKTPLEALGFKKLQKADKLLASMAGAPPTSDIFAKIKPALLKALGDSPDPDLALTNLKRFSDAVFSRDTFYQLLQQQGSLIERVVLVFSWSQYLADTLINDPEFLEFLLSDATLGKARPLERVEAELKDIIDVFQTSDGKANAIRRFKRRELLRIGIRDILGLAPLPEIAKELAIQAETALEAALRVSWESLEKTYGVFQGEANFAVIGLGKLGGAELNYSSDIDVIFVYEGEGETAGPRVLSAHDFCARLGEGIIKVLSAPTDQGQAFRVDTDLRPEGRDGPLVRSLESYAEYYRRWAETWEFQALLKARPVAGSKELGRKFLELIEPMVYREHLEPSTLEDIKNLKRRSEAYINKARGGEWHVKLGAGGIRDIEFTIQLLQLLYGHRRRSLRTPNTLEALEALAGLGFLAPQESDILKDNYMFLRKIEHYLQIMGQLQLHHLPRNEVKREKIARRLGYRDGDGSALAEFDEHFRAATKSVREIFVRIFHSDSYRPDEKPSLASVLYNPHLSTEVRLNFLGTMGFENRERAYRELQELAASPESQKFFIELGNRLLKEMAETPDADLSLHNFHLLVAAVGARANLYRLLLENDWARGALIRLFGTSSVLSETLTLRPEFMDVITDRARLAKFKPKSKVEAELTSRMTGLKTDRAKLNALRRFKRRELLRIGVRDILGLAPLPEVTKELTVQAEAALKAALGITWEALEQTYGSFDGGGDFAVIGLGKLGGAELNYSSDIDVIFVYEGEGKTAGPRVLSAYEFFTRLSEGIIKVLAAPTEQGQVFRVDANLRPEGRDGPLVRSLESYAEYYRRWAETWEFQALLKARPVAGSKELGREFLKLIKPMVYSSHLEPSVVEEIRKMKRRIEEERAGDQAKFNVKLGPGTIIDVEFTTQYLQLKHGGRSAKTRNPNTLKALEGLWKDGLIEEESYLTLRDGYLFLRKVENRLQIERGFSESVLPSRQDELIKLSRRLGYENGQKGERVAEIFMADYERVTQSIRRLSDQILEISA